MKVWFIDIASGEAEGATANEAEQNYYKAKEDDIFSIIDNDRVHEVPATETAKKIVRTLIQITNIEAQ